MSSNKGHIIALVKTTNESKPSAFRLWYQGHIKDVNYYILLNTMTNSDCIENAKVENGEIIGTDGRIDNYGIVNTTKQILRNSFVIIEKLGLTDTNGTVMKVIYRLVNTLGESQFCTTELTTKYAELIGIANAKLMQNGNISPINGEYPYSEISEEEFNAKHNVTEYQNPIEVLQGSWEIETKDRGEHEKDDKAVNLKGIDNILTEATERFNSAVTKILDERGTEYETREAYLDVRYGDSIKINTIKYPIQINEEDCFIHQGQALVKLKTDVHYHWHLVNYAQNTFGELIYNKSFNKCITSELLGKIKMTTEEFEQELINTSGKLGENAAKFK